MPAVAVLDDLRPLEDGEEVQLVLDETAFGAPTLRAMIRAGAVITPVALDLSGMEQEPTFQRYEQLGFYLGLMNRSCMWWIGDWLVYGEGRYGDQFAQALAITGLAEQTLLNRMSVCRSIPPDERVVGLSFSVHAELAGLGARDRRYWLRRAQTHSWNRQQLRDAMKAKRTEERPPLPDPTPGHIDKDQVVEAALRVASAKQEYGADFLVPREAMMVLVAALGQEE